MLGCYFLSACTFSASARVVRARLHRLSRGMDCVANAELVPGCGARAPVLATSPCITTLRMLWAQWCTFLKATI